MHVVTPKVLVCAVTVLMSSYHIQMVHFTSRGSLSHLRPSDITGPTLIQVKTANLTWKFSSFYFPPS